MSATASAEEVDGRRLRRTLNREAVLDAMAELFAEGNLQPSSADIAERAGISPRSLFRYFDDQDDLNRACIERALAHARPLLELDVDASAPTVHKIVAIVEQRVRLFEAIAAPARATRVSAWRHPVVAAQLHDARQHFREQVRRTFATEVAASTMLPAVDALLSFETYELLRHDQDLSRGKTVQVLCSALAALLDAPR